MKITAVNMTEKEYLLPGNRTCPGCALSLAYRYILKALEGQVIATVPASCLTVLAIRLHRGIGYRLGCWIESLGQRRVDRVGYCW